MTDLTGQHAMKRRPDWAALCVAALLMAIAAIIAWDTSRLGGGGAYARIGPQTVPFAIALCLAGLSIWTVFEAMAGEFPEREPQDFLPVLWIVGGLIVQMALLRVAGFSIATGILFAMTARAFGRVNLALVLPAGIVIAAAVWFVFARLLQLSLPAATVEGWIVIGADWLVANFISGYQSLWAAIQGLF
jgi:putative tricarboxylic transport membrane protein